MFDSRKSGTQSDSTRNARVAVVLSVYNDGSSITETLESILCQTFLDFEFIIVNDGSTDATAEILNGYVHRDARIKVIHQVNRGLTASLNRGLFLTSCEYIARQDSGDLSHTERLKTQLDFLDMHKEVAACFSWVDIIDEHSKKVSEYVFSNKPSRIQRNLLSGRNIYTHGSVMFRRSAVMNVGGYDESLRASQDFDLWLRLLKSGCRIGAVNRHLYAWRLTHDSISFKQRTRQRTCGGESRRRHDIRTGTNLWRNPPVDDRYALLHFYQNIYFRARARKDIFKNTLKLLKVRDLSFRELCLFLICMLPLDYSPLLKRM